MRSIRANYNLLAISANAKESAINTEQTMNISLPMDMEGMITLQQRRENNSNEATGLEEPDVIYDNGALAQASFPFSKAQPQHFATILAFGLGSIVTTAAGAGYLHTITPIDGEVDSNRSVPSFTAMQKMGDTILKRRFISMFVEGFTASFAKDDWVKLTADIKGTGKYIDNVTEETISYAGNGTSLTLAANAVEGATAALRLDNVQRIRAETAAGVWTEVVYTAVSSATPAVITVVAPAVAADAISWKVLYVPDEAAPFTFPAKVQETPLRVSEMTVVMGGKWTGSAFSGGRTLTSEINSIEWKFANNLEVSFVPGAGGAYAGDCFRQGRNQTITLSRKMKEFIIQQHVISNDTFGFRILCEGAIFDSPHKYSVEVIFPKCAILTADPNIDGKTVAEGAEIQVLEDATYGSVICNVKNLQTAYAA